jgi:hypothetical protein
VDDSIEVNLERFRIRLIDEDSHEFWIGLPDIDISQWCLTLESWTYEKSIGFIFLFRLGTVTKRLSASDSPGGGRGVLDAACGRAFRIFRVELSLFWSTA